MPQTNILEGYKEKVELAVSMVISMSAEQKLEAVQFWNIMSEKLQDIVNHSAADLTAISFALEKEKQQQPTEYIEDGAGQTYHLLTSTNNSGSTMALITKYSKAETRSSIKTESPDSVNEDDSTPTIKMENTTEIQNKDFSTNEINNKKSPTEVAASTSSNNAEEKQMEECEYCEKTFATASQLSAHKWKHIKPYICDECGARFGSKTNLIVHSRSHTGERPFSCELCGVTFSTKGNLKRHYKSHSGAKPWECTQCGAKFSENRSLKIHIRRHTGERPYKCTMCPKAFAQKGILQSHLALHLGQKTHLCDTCGKAFRQKSQLRLHTQRHNNLKRFSCDHCPAQFLTKGDMQRHSRTHTGERPFSCGLCNKTFTRQQTLTEHMNRHYGLKPYLCKYCRKGFSEMSACYKHIKTHEKGKINEDNSTTTDESSNTLLLNDVTIQKPVCSSVIVEQEHVRMEPNSNSEIIMTGEFKGKAVSVLQKSNATDTEDELESTYNSNYSK